MFQTQSPHARIFHQPFIGAKKTRNFTPGKIIRDFYGREYRADETGALRRIPSDHEQPRNYTAKRLARLNKSQKQ